MSELLNRRAFTMHALGAVTTYTLLETVLGQDAVDDKIKPITKKWLTDVNDLAAAVKGRKLLQVDWQAKVEELFAKVDLADLLTLLDFDRLTARPPRRKRPRGETSLRVRLPRVDGLPTKYVFGRQIFALDKGRSIVPHGHNNMATAFLILKGDFRGRLWDRVEDGGGEILIRPTIDRPFGVGACSTISDYKDNVHWFEATSGPAYVFNIHVVRIRESKLPTRRVYLDPTGPKTKSGLIRARRISHREALRKFG